MNESYWVFTQAQLENALSDFLLTIPDEHRPVAEEAIRKFMTSPAAESHRLIAHIGGAT